MWTNREVTCHHYKGDTCHHCKGDTWHACMTTRGRVWSIDREDDMVTGHLLFDDVAFLDEWEVATWPKHGLPRGTHSLVVAFDKKLLERNRFEPWTSMGEESSQRLGTSLPTPWNLQLYVSEII
jgi:hypothetical protein